MSKTLIHTLTYVSTATELLDNEALNSLLNESRARNATHHITGMLLYHDGTFMQTIEGAPEDVNTLYENLCRDQRHYGVIKLVHEPIASRVFPDWAMGFKNGPGAVDGYTDYLSHNSEPDRKNSDMSHGELLLSSFRTHVRNA